MRDKKARTARAPRCHFPVTGVDVSPIFVLLCHGIGPVCRWFPGQNAAIEGVRNLPRDLHCFLRHQHVDLRFGVPHVGLGHFFNRRLVSFASNNFRAGSFISSSLLRIEPLRVYFLGVAAAGGAGTPIEAWSTTYRQPADDL